MREVVITTKSLLNAIGWVFRIVALTAYSLVGLAMVGVLGLIAVSRSWELVGYGLGLALALVTGVTVLFLVGGKVEELYNRNSTLLKFGGKPKPQLAKAKVVTFDCKTRKVRPYDGPE